MSTESQTTASPRPADQAVAVIGLGALFPGGRPGVAGYWSLVRDGLDAISDVPADHFLAEDYYDPDPKAQDRIYCRRGAFIPKVPFQPLRYGVTPRDLESIDTTQLLGLVVADEALRDAGYPPGGPGHARTAVIMGVTGALKMVVGLGSRLVHPHLRRALAESGVGGDLAEEVIGRLLEKFPPWRESSFPGLLGNVTAGRVANRLDLGGPNMVVDAACASSLAAIGQALQTLRAGRADLVVSGGLDTFSDPFMFSCFSKTPALSPSGEVRPFDRAGDGTLLGEGLGVVVLKRLEDAERDGDRVYARILSVGGSSDGRGTAIFAPSPSGQRRAIEAAYDEAGWDPGQVDLVEAHGTGTAVGDGVELEALGGHFAGSRPDGGGPWCALGSVKSQIGHAKGAAGVAGLIKAVLALFHKVLPPTIKVRDPQGPLADPSFPLYLNDRARPWLSAPGRPRRAGVSAFGFGGSNFHCLLEESRAPKPPDEGGVHLVALSAGGPGELASALAPLAAADGDPALSLLARGLARSFRADAPARLALAGSLAEVSLLARTLPALLGGRPGDLPRGAFLGLAGETAPGGLVLSLPGPPAGFDPAPLGRALSALAISFPSVQECLDLAEGLRVSRGLSDHNLGLVLLPPRLAPAAFRARLEAELRGPALSALAWSLAQVALARLAGDLGIPVAGCRAGGPGLLAGLFWASRLGAAEALGLSVDLALGLGVEPAEGPFGGLSGPDGPLDSREAFLAALAAGGGTGGPASLLGPGGDAWPLLDADDPMYGLASVLARLAAGGLAPDLAAWPGHAPDPDGPEGPSVPVGGANLFAPPPPRPAGRPAAGLDDQGAQIREILDNQRRGLRLLESLGQAARASGGPLPAAPARPEPAARGGNGKSNGRGLPPAPAALEGAVWDRLALVVSQETGYPAEALDPGMSLENDLGLDSIKRVELLSALAETFPGLSGPGADPASPATLGELEGLCAAQAAPAGGAATGQDRARAAVFGILSAETGYPADSLHPDMRLENDLGLDSIKRVEILSALAERFPQASPGLMAEAGTLGRILEIVSGAVPAAGAAARAGLLETVAAETGFPVDSLDQGMDLEQDLGLDSIKKVEILSLLTEGLPGQVDQERLSAARTLGDWQACLDEAASARPAAAGGGNGGAAPARPAPAPPGPASGREILDRVLGTGAKDRPSLWQVEPEPFSAAGQGACLWPPSGLVRLVGTDPLAKGLERELKALGYEVERRPWRYDFDQWKDDGQKPRVLFLVWPGPDRDPGLITQALKALAAAGDRLESIVGLSFLGGFFGFPRPGGLPGVLGNSISGALVGLLKCAAREWPGVSVRALDLPLAVYNAPSAGWLSAILETAAGPGPVELGLPKSDRAFRLALRPYHPAESPEPLLAPGDTVVATGGGRGVTAAALLALARLYRPRLVILGRTPLPPPEPEWLSRLSGEREIMEALFGLSGRSGGPRELEARARLILSSRELSRNLRALEEAGARVEYVSGDFTSPALIEDTARRIRSRFGPIRGFIHGAGVLADHPIVGKDHSDFDRVYATKTLLASLLLEAFQPEPLRLMVFFSSTTARFGRQGQGDYAAGNEVLNKTAWEMATLHPDCRVLALNWGPWAGGMVNEALAGQFRSQGLGLIGLEEGAETFLRLIRTPAGGPAEVVVLGHGTSLELLGGPWAPEGGAAR